MSHTYTCDRCGTTHPYRYEDADIQPKKACVWGGCSGTAHPVSIAHDRVDSETQQQPEVG